LSNLGQQKKASDPLFLSDIWVQFHLQDVVEFVASE
jgi:hypothetical protein